MAEEDESIGDEGYVDMTFKVRQYITTFWNLNKPDKELNKEYSVLSKPNLGCFQVSFPWALLHFFLGLFNLSSYTVTFVICLFQNIFVNQI